LLTALSLLRARAPSIPASAVLAILLVVAFVAAMFLFGSAVVAVMILLASLRVLWPSQHVVPVPDMIDEIDRMPAGVVLVTVPLPVFPMFQWHPQIHRLGRRYRRRWRLDDQGLCHDHLRLRILADVDPTEHSRLTELYRYAHIGCGRAARQAKAKTRDGEDSFHCAVPSMESALVSVGFDQAYKH
jgi:hypothetical protein